MNPDPELLGQVGSGIMVPGGSDPGPEPLDKSVRFWQIFFKMVQFVFFVYMHISLENLKLLQSQKYCSIPIMYT